MKAAIWAWMVCVTTMVTPAKAVQPSGDEVKEARPTYTYVIVHGATGGGWDWKGVDRILTAKGHTVYRPTLTGLGERAHLASREIDLTTHINDIVNVILFEDLHDVILVGHSYAGMVITGVMDRIPERLKHVVFADAIIPEDGQSCMDTKQLGPHPIEDGMLVFPWTKTPTAPPTYLRQSLKTFTEPVSYKNPRAKRLNVTVIDFIAPDETPKKRAARTEQEEHLRIHRGWTIRMMESDHMANRTHPQELVELLERAPSDTNAVTEVREAGS